MEDLDHGKIGKSIEIVSPQDPEVLRMIRTWNKMILKMCEGVTGRDDKKTSADKARSTVDQLVHYRLKIRHNLHTESPDISHLTNSNVN